MSWISLNAQWAIASGALKFPPKPTSVSNCSYEFDTNYFSLNPINVNER